MISKQIKREAQLAYDGKGSHQEIYTPIQTSAIIYQSPKIIAALVTHPAAYSIECVHDACHLQNTVKFLKCRTKEQTSTLFEVSFEVIRKHPHCRLLLPDVFV